MATENIIQPVEVKIRLGGLAEVLQLSQKHIRGCTPEMIAVRDGFVSYDQSAIIRYDGMTPGNVDFFDLTFKDPKSREPYRLIHVPAIRLSGAHRSVESSDERRLDLMLDEGDPKYELEPRVVPIEIVKVDPLELVIKAYTPQQF